MFTTVSAGNNSYVSSHFSPKIQIRVQSYYKFFKFARF
jgi:hypothetical protein